jgi:hypothetical protein
LQTAATTQKVITATISVSVVLLAIPIPYGHQAITPASLAVALSDGLAIGLLGSAIDGAIGYRQLLLERFLVWATLTLSVIYISSRITPAFPLCVTSTGIAALVTAMLEIILPASARD